MTYSRSMWYTGGLCSSSLVTFNPGARQKMCADKDTAKCNLKALKSVALFIHWWFWMVTVTTYELTNPAFLCLVHILEPLEVGYFNLSWDKFDPVSIVWLSDCHFPITLFKIFFLLLNSCIDIYLLLVDTTLLWTSFVFLKPFIGLTIAICLFVCKPT